MMPSNIGGEGVQAALLLVGAGPATRAFVVVAVDGTRAAIRRAADARVALIVQGIVWKLVAYDVPPDFFLAPRGEWIDFQIPVTLRRFLQLQNLRPFARFTLRAAKAGDHR